MDMLVVAFRLLSGAYSVWYAHLSTVERPLEATPHVLWVSTDEDDTSMRLTYDCSFCMY